MNKTNAKKLHMGYELRINQSGQPGAKNWVRVGDSFSSTHAASKYRETRYPNVVKYLIMGINFSAVPKVPERYQTQTDKPKDLKKGNSNASK